MKYRNTNWKQLGAAILFAGQFTAVSPVFSAPLTVVIDPGHGGEDMGATFKHRGKTYTEKRMVMLLANELQKELRRRKVRTVLTRHKDVELPLSVRTGIANKIGADVFVSIHMNSSHKPTKTARGIETYILNNSNNKLSTRLADLENSVSTLEGSAAKQNEKKDVALIVKDLMLNANLAESKRLACMIQGKVSGLKNHHNRGIKQALFYVLMGADMPSVLFEAGFLNNTQDRKKILYKRYRRKIARAMADAIVSFKREKGTKKAQRTLAKCQVR